MPSERQWIRRTFTGRAGNRKRTVTFATDSKARDTWAILDKNRRIQRSAHPRHRVDVLRMNHTRVPVAMLAGSSQLNRLIDRFGSNDRNERHHLLMLDERVAGIGLAK